MAMNTAGGDQRNVFFFQIQFLEQLQSACQYSCKSKIGIVQRVCGRRAKMACRVFGILDDDGIGQSVLAHPLFQDQSYAAHVRQDGDRSEEHTSELQSLMRISYAVFCLKKKNKTQQ